MVEINNKTSYLIKEAFLKKIAQKILKDFNKKPGKGKSLSIALVLPKEIQKLNKKYRKKNRPTDVLSFEGQNNELGEVIICPAILKINAKKYQASFKKELERVLIHGILHLLGYDHEKSERAAQEMQKKEKYYINKIT